MKFILFNVFAFLFTAWNAQAVVVEVPLNNSGDRIQVDVLESGLARVLNYPASSKGVLEISIKNSALSQKSMSTGYCEDVSTRLQTVNDYLPDTLKEYFIETTRKENLFHINIEPFAFLNNSALRTQIWEQAKAKGLNPPNIVLENPFEIVKFNIVLNWQNDALSKKLGINPEWISDLSQMLQLGGLSSLVGQGSIHAADFACDLYLGRAQLIVEVSALNDSSSPPNYVDADTAFKIYRDWTYYFESSLDLETNPMSWLKLGALAAKHLEDDGPTLLGAVEELKKLFDEDQTSLKTLSKEQIKSLFEPIGNYENQIYTSQIEVREKQ